ncbi:MAG: hypothetical protein WD873_09370, partial [Candidatus Hydrogenedentales bacterium]
MTKLWNGSVYLLCLISFISCRQQTVKEHVMDVPEIQRFARERARELATLSAVQPVGTRWQVHGAAGVKSTAEGMQLAPGDLPAVLSLDVQQDAARYTEFLVRMKSDAGGHAMLSWRSPLDPVPREDRAMQIPIFSDGEFHTYRIPLGVHTDTRWVDQIEEVYFAPSDTPANVEITRLELRHTPDPAPQRLTLHLQTHEALYGNQPDWRLVPEPGSKFEVFAGMPYAATERPAFDGVEFVVTVLDGTGAEEPLLRKRLQPAVNNEDRGWHRLESDLSKFAGREIALRMTVDPLENRLGDYAYWGSPIVYQATPDSEKSSTPVILISHDTLRADHLAVYGYERETAPNLTAFAEDAV